MRHPALTSLPSPGWHLAAVFIIVLPHASKGPQERGLRTARESGEKGAMCVFEGRKEFLEINSKVSFTVIVFY